MVEKDPLFREASPESLRAYRDAKSIAAQEQALREAEIERELAELDGAIAGMDAGEMEALRDWVSAAKPQDEEASGVVRKQR